MKTFLEQVPDSLTCPLRGAAGCYVEMLYLYQGAFFIQSIQVETEANSRIFQDSLINYGLLVGGGGQWSRIGDSLFAAYEAPYLGKRDSVRGGIALLNLRDTPWCEDSWKRGEKDRGKGK